MNKDFRICGKCKAEISRDYLDRNYSICPECGNYLRMHLLQRKGVIYRLVQQVQGKQ